MQPSRRLGEAELLSDGDEIAEMPEFHGLPLCSKPPFHFVQRWAAWAGQGTGRRTLAAKRIRPRLGAGGPNPNTLTIAHCSVHGLWKLIPAARKPGIVCCT